VYLKTAPSPTLAVIGGKDPNVHPVVPPISIVAPSTTS